MRTVVDLVTLAPTWIWPAMFGGCAILAALVVFGRDW